MISAVILAYNRCSEVLITISSLKNLRASLTFNLQIVVVDNASVDDTSAVVKAQHPDVTLVTKKKNNGIAGWNEGFKVATEKYILVLDDDSNVESGLTEAIDYLENNNDIGILALQIKDLYSGINDKLDSETAWKNKQDVEGFIGCGAIIRKDVYDKIGGYAEWIYVYTHEFDYSLRCLNAGYRVVFFGNTVVLHRKSKVNRTNNRAKIYTTRNEMAIVYKFFPKRRWTYLWRVWINSLKSIKGEGFSSGYNVILGSIKFLKLRKTLAYTPVSPEVQKYYTDRFHSTKPIFYKLRKKLFS
jgi:GT2 family glycosyltransferase